MVYSASITTVSGTSESDPLITDIKAVRGILYKFDVYFPPGPSGLVGVQFRVADHQIYPVQRDQWFLGDNLTISFEDVYELSNPNAIVSVRTYNADDTYDHLVQVRFGLMMHDEFFARYGLALGVERLEETLKTIEEQTRRTSKLTIEQAMAQI